MTHTQHCLMTVFLLFLAAYFILIAGFESEILPMGMFLSQHDSVEFVVLSITEVLDIAIIPVALRLFKMKRVSRQLTTPKAILKWGMIRMLMLCVPMLADVLFYYLFLNVAFGYLGVILFLCLFFIIPTKDRCYSELNIEEQTRS